MIHLLLVTAALVAPVKPPTNTICPVVGDKVSAKSAKVEVRGHTYYICCADCGPKLKANPDKYLMPNGTPKNAAPANDHGGHQH